MANNSFTPVNGIIQSIRPHGNDCCRQTAAIRNANGITNMIITPDTYVINQVTLRPGMAVTAFYDSNAPAPLIFPPQFNASIIGRRNPNETIAVNFFNRNLTASDNSLQLNISPFTQIITSNGQLYSCSVANQQLIVFYSETTRSLPPQTTPRRIIVMC